MSEIAERHILVTGGASGIGRLMAKKLAALGGRISVWDIHPENLDRVVTELSRGYGRAYKKGFSSATGDIVIATGVAKRQAKDAGHSLQAELRVLALHGLLHLLGYDHHARDDGGQMARVEARLRRKGGLTSGLIERASSASTAQRARR